MKRIYFFIFLLFPLIVSGSTWKLAFPYQQKIQGQNIIIRSVPYAPRDGEPFGKTMVFDGKKLLYSFDKYFRQTIIPSNDGVYVAVINRFLFSQFYLQKLGDRTVIDIYRNGELYKSYKLKELIKPIKPDNKYGFAWGYKYPMEGNFSEIKDNCKSCLSVYGRKVLNDCNESEILDEVCIECNSDCDIVNNYEVHRKVMDNWIFIENNVLNIITIDSKIIQIDMSNPTAISKSNLEILYPDLSKFDPPRIKKKQKIIKYPEKFYLPDLENGENIGDELSDFLMMKISDDYNDPKTLSIYIHTLLINQQGKCEIAYVSSDDKKLDKKIENWIKQKKFDTSKIPKKFEKYKFSDFVYLKNASY